MSKNFTPLPKENQEKNSKLNVALLVVAAVTALILAIVLFLLIQQRLSDSGKTDPLPTQQAKPATPAPLSPTTSLEPEPTTASEEVQLAPAVESTQEAVVSPNP